MNEPLANCVMYDLLQNFAVGGCFFYTIATKKPAVTPVV